MTINSRLLQTKGVKLLVRRSAEVGKVQGNFTNMNPPKEGSHFPSFIKDLMTTDKGPWPVLAVAIE